MKPRWDAAGMELEPPTLHLASRKLFINSVL
jgi:hypothetical protein